MSNKLNQTQHKEMYKALLHFVNSESANMILHNLEDAIREDTGNTFGSVEEYFDYHYKQWCIVRDKFLTEEKLKQYTVESLLGAAISRYLYAAFIWNSSPQGGDYWYLIVEIIGMSHNKMVEQHLAI